jgi:hypothetical protein
VRKERGEYVGGGVEDGLNEITSSIHGFSYALNLSHSSEGDRKEEEGQIDGGEGAQEDGGAGRAFGEEECDVEGAEDLQSLRWLCSLLFESSTVPQLWRSEDFGAEGGILEVGLETNFGGSNRELD